MFARPLYNTLFDVEIPAQTCSNGLPGYEAANMCCPLYCGGCGGKGCSKRGDGCCTSDIKDSGVKCSSSKSAPCVIDTDRVGEIREDVVL